MEEEAGRDCNVNVNISVSSTSSNTSLLDNGLDLFPIGSINGSKFNDAGMSGLIQMFFEGTSGSYWERKKRLIDNDASHLDRLMMKLAWGSNHIPELKRDAAKAKIYVAAECIRGAREERGSSFRTLIVGTWNYRRIGVSSFELNASNFGMFELKCR